MYADPTTHGGTVVSASPTTIIMGKPVARLGDSVTCPLPGHGVVTIVEGDTDWLVDGRPVALEGHKTSCGASLISTLGTVIRSPIGSGATHIGLSAATAIAAAVTSATSRDDDALEYFFVAEREDGSSVDLAYRIDKGAEILNEGVLGSDGCTDSLPMSQVGEAVFWIPQA